MKTICSSDTKPADVPTASTSPAALPAWRVFVDRRAPAWVMFLCSSAVLGVAAWLSPDAEGVGTHTQLGLSPCSLYASTGMPCATCGMTTAFSHAAHGDLVGSFMTQPAGSVLALLTAAGCIVGAWAGVTGASLGPLLRLTYDVRLLSTFGVLILLAWIYKVCTVPG